MKDYVREMLARHLGVPVSRITLWRLTAGQGSQQMQSRGRTVCAPGMLEAELEVVVAAGPLEVKLLTADPTRGGGLAIKDVSPYVQMGQERTSVTLILLHGKDTQHLFKAVHQAFTVRGRQKGKKK